MKIKVDLDLCQGHSVCIAEAPEIFDVIETTDGYPQVLVLDDSPSEELYTKVRAAAKYCPNNVITLVED